MKEAVSAWIDMPDLQRQRFVSIFEPRSLESLEHLLHAGSKDRVLVFVSQGLLRLYYTTDDGKESINQALEPTRLLVTDYDDYDRLFDEHPAFDRLGRKLLELSLQRKELRERSFLEQTAKERYIDFMRDHADLARRLPQYHIASYLGITEVTLSRLRGGLMRERVS